MSEFRVPLTCRTLGHALVDGLCAWCGYRSCDGCDSSGCAYCEADDS